jgi:hypothetical protein
MPGTPPNLVTLRVIVYRVANRENQRHQHLFHTPPRFQHDRFANNLATPPKVSWCVDYDNLDYKVDSGNKQTQQTTIGENSTLLLQVHF